MTKLRRLTSLIERTETSLLPLLIRRHLIPTSRTIKIELLMRRINSREDKTRIDSRLSTRTVRLRYPKSKESMMREKEPTADSSRALLHSENFAESNAKSIKLK